MPVLAYFIVMGTALFALLMLSNYGLPDVGPAIRTSQLVGLPKVKAFPGPESRAPSVTISNFAAPKNGGPELPDKVYAKDKGTISGKNLYPKQQRKNEDNSVNARAQRLIPAYSYNAMMKEH